MRTAVYRGWYFCRGPDHPVTGQWRAERNGVGLSAGTEAQLMRMIDAKVADEQRERDQRAAQA